MNNCYALLAWMPLREYVQWPGSWQLAQWPSNGMGLADPHANSVLCFTGMGCLSESMYSGLVAGNWPSGHLMTWALRVLMHIIELVHRAVVAL